jgi:hypothetical protein
VCAVPENAKWFLNVQWQMEGVDIHLDTNVGKQLSALGHTMTSITGSEEDEHQPVDYDSDDQVCIQVQLFVNGSWWESAAYFQNILQTKEMVLKI